MATIAQTPVPFNHPNREHADADHLMTLALCEAIRRALRAYPANARVVKAAQIALARKVTLLDTGHAEVASQFGTTTYAVQGAHCPCPDKQRTREHCKHEFAASMVRKAHRLLAEAAARNEETGTRCPHCGHQSVYVERHGRGEHRHDWRICRWAWELGLEVVECPWREVVA